MYYIFLYIYIICVCVCVILFMVICRCFQRPGRVLVGAIPGVLAPDRSALLPHRVMNGEQLWCMGILCQWLKDCHKWWGRRSLQYENQWKSQPATRSFCFTRDLQMLHQGEAPRTNCRDSELLRIFSLAWDWSFAPRPLATWKWFLDQCCQAQEKGLGLRQLKETWNLEVAKKMDIWWQSQG